jgi:hypothetical protein
MPGEGSTGLSCREIERDDLPAIIDLLCAGFPKRTRIYWEEGLQRLAAHRPPDGVPKFGYLLVSDGVPVGVLLLIFSGDSDAGLRCNVSSWYVRPEYRAYGPLLSMRATRSKTISYLNIWPADHTLQTIEAQGFSRATGGFFAGVPALGRIRNDVRITSDPGGWQRSRFISPSEAQLLADHAAFGCMCLWAETETAGHPFIFKRRLTRLLRVPCAMLIYANSLDDVEDLAGPVGRFLALKGLPVMVVGADRPLKRMPGKHFESKMQLYSKGSRAPRGSDLSYTEAAVFGL